MRGRLTKWLCGIGLVFELLGLVLRRGKRLLVVSRFAGIGDIVCTFPAVREFIRQNPGTPVVYVTRTCYVPLVRRSGLGIPCVGVGQQILLPAWTGWIIGRHVHLSYADEDESNKPTREALAEPLVQAFGTSLGLASLTGEPTLEVNRDRVEKIRAPHLSGEKKGVILLHTGPTWKVREWPMDSWTQLVARLNEKLRYEILQISADRNASLSDASAVTIPGATPVACSDDIETLVHTVAAADLLIGIDSGPIHIAAAVNTPFVSLFGPVNPALRLSKGNLPEALVHQLDCSFCHHRRPRGHWRTGCPKDIACMVEISVGRVFEKSVELLARGR